MKPRTSGFAGCFVAAAVAAFVCYLRWLGPGLEEFAAERERLADESTDLQIALVWRDPQSSSFCRGAELAASELNRQGGITVTGKDGTRRARRVKLLTYDETAHAEYYEKLGRGPEPPGLRIAREVAENTSTLAVIGHDADTEAPAALVYERAGLLFLASNTAEGVLPRLDSDLVFRMGPSERQTSEAMVAAMTQLSQVRTIKAAVLYPEFMKQQLGDISADLAGHANRIAAERGDAVTVEVAFARTYVRGRREHRQVIRSLLDVLEQIDIILIADGLPDAAVLWQEIKDELAAKTGSDMIPVPIASLETIDASLTSIRESERGSKTQQEFFDELAALVLRESRLQVAILSSRTPFGRRLRSSLNTNVELHSLATDIQWEVVVNQSFGPHPEDHAELVADVLRHSIDFAFVADRSGASAALIDRLRREGFGGPIICPPDLESAVLRGGRVATADPDAVRSPGQTYVVSTFDTQSPQAQVQAFITKFHDRFKQHPDADAAFGYLAVRLIARGCEIADSIQPRAVAQALRQIDEHDPFFGHNQFFRRGELLGVEFVLKYAGADGKTCVTALDDSKHFARAVLAN